MNKNPIHTTDVLLNIASTSVGSTEILYYQDNLYKAVIVDLTVTSC